jgi:hypothetical protein
MQYADKDADKDNSEDGYLPVSRLAIAAAVVGVASAAAVANPLFLVIPLVGAGLSVASLADVDREGSPKAGRLAALAGLALSIGFGLQSAVHLGVSYMGARGRAVAIAEAFVVAAGEQRYDDAIVMCRYDALPDTTTPQSSGPFNGEAGAEMREKFVLMPTIATLASCGSSEPRVEQSRSEDIEGESWVVTLAVPSGEGASGDVVIDVTVSRDPTSMDTDRWLVTGHTLQ